MIPHHSTNATRLIEYAKLGASPTEISRALGITPSAVTQLMDTPEVSAELKRLQEEQLARSSALDNKYDIIEDKLLAQLERTLPMLVKPHEIARVLAQVNSAKRRGVAATTSDAPQKVISLTLPTVIQNKFIVNSANQVVEAGAQQLVTIPSANVTKLAESHTHGNSKETKQLSPPQTGEEDEFGFTY